MFYFNGILFIILGGAISLVFLHGKLHYTTKTDVRNTTKTIVNSVMDDHIRSKQHSIVRSIIGFLNNPYFESNNKKIDIRKSIILGFRFMKENDYSDHHYMDLLLLTKNDNLVRIYFTTFYDSQKEYYTFSNKEIYTTENNLGFDDRLTSTNSKPSKHTLISMYGEHTVEQLDELGFSDVYRTIMSSEAEAEEL